MIVEMFISSQQAFVQLWIKQLRHQHIHRLSRQRPFSPRKLKGAFFKLRPQYRFQHHIPQLPPTQLQRQLRRKILPTQIIQQNNRRDFEGVFFLEFGEWGHVFTLFKTKKLEIEPRILYHK